MQVLGPTTALAFLVVIQIIGLASAWMTRLGEGSVTQRFYQAFFVGWLSLVGLATFGALMLGPESCMICGTTLAVMALTATWDFGTAVA
jgi:hypothetical protein